MATPSSLSSSWPTKEPGTALEAPNYASDAYVNFTREEAYTEVLSKLESEPQCMLNACELLLLRHFENRLDKQSKVLAQLAATRYQDELAQLLEIPLKRPQTKTLSEQAHEKSPARAQAAQLMAMRYQDELTQMLEIRDKRSRTKIPSEQAREKPLLSSSRLPYIDHPESGSLQEARKMLCSIGFGEGDQRDQRASFLALGSYQYALPWRIGTFMWQQFGSRAAETPLSSAVVFIGDELDAEALTVGEYVKRTWSELGERFLRCIENALRHPNHVSNEFYGGIPGNSSVTAIEVKLRLPAWLSDPESVAPKGFDEALNSRQHGEFALIECMCTEMQHNQVAPLLGWLGSALAVRPKSGLATSSFNYKWIHERRLSKFSFETKIVSPKRPCCWHELVPNAVVARSYLASFGEERKGLRLDFHLMAALAGVKVAVAHERSVVLKGFSTLLLPVMASESSVQWHLESNSCGRRIPYRRVEEFYSSGNPAPDLDFKAMRTRTVYLGWCPNARTHLGTTDGKYSSVSPTSLPESGRRGRIKDVTLGLQNIGVGGVGFSLGAKDGNFHIYRGGALHQVVQFAERVPVCLYGPDVQTAWLVHAAETILHILHLRKEKKALELMPNEVLIHATPEDGCQATRNALAKNATLQMYDPLLKRASGGLVLDMIMEIWSVFEYCMDQRLNEENQEGIAIRGTLRAELHGYELMDVVRMKSPFRKKTVKITKTGGNWYKLVYHTDSLVLFANGLGDLIRPIPDAAKDLCEAWSLAPKGKDYLVSRVSLLQMFYEEAGCPEGVPKNHLTRRGLQWHRSSHLFEKCENQTRLCCACDRVQELLDDDCTTFGRVAAPGALLDDGAVIFGKGGVGKRPGSLSIFDFRPSSKRA